MRGREREGGKEIDITYYSCVILHSVMIAASNFTTESCIWLLGADIFTYQMPDSCPIFCLRESPLSRAVSGDQTGRVVKHWVCVKEGERSTCILHTLQATPTSPRRGVVLPRSQSEHGVILHIVVPQSVDSFPTSLHDGRAVLISQDHVIHGGLQVLCRK